MILEIYDGRRPSRLTGHRLLVLALATVSDLSPNF